MECPSHHQLLLEVLRLSPSLAGPFLGALTLTLEPQLNTKWLAGMAVISQGVAVASSSVAPFSALAQR